MFICNDCLESYTNLPSPIQSAGRCESCGNSRVCNDIPSRNLVPRKDLSDPNRPSRLGLLFQEEPEPEYNHEEHVEELGQGGVFWALVRYFSEIVGPAEEPRIRLLFNEEMQTRADVKDLLRRHEAYNIVLIGESDEDRRAVNALRQHATPVLTRVRTYPVRLWNDRSDLNPAVLVASALDPLAQFAGCHSSLNEATRAMIMASMGGAARRAADLDEYVMNQMDVMKSASEWPAYWLTFLNNLFDRLEKKQELPRGGALCIHIETDYVMHFDYSRFLRQLERMGHPRVVFLIQMREELLKMCLTASYARRWQGAHQRRLTEDAAREAEYQARHDMMRYTRLYSFAAPEPDPNERIEMFRPEDL